MKNIFTLLGLFIIVLCSAQPGTPDPNGVITAGPPDWVSGTQTGQGELALQFTYLNAAILLNDAEIAVIEDSITDISARSLVNATQLQDSLGWTNLSDVAIMDALQAEYFAKYGLISGDNTDMASALQAAIDDADNALYCNIPNGVYDIESSIVLGNNNQFVNFNWSTIDAQDISDGSAAIQITPTIDEGRLENVYIDGGSSAKDCDGIRVGTFGVPNASARWGIKNIEIANCDTAFMNFGWEQSFSDVLMKSSNVGFVTEQCGGSVFKKFDFSSLDSKTFSLETAAGVHLDGWVLQSAQAADTSALMGTIDNALNLTITSMYLEAGSGVERDSSWIMFGRKTLVRGLTINGIESGSDTDEGVPNLAFDNVENVTGTVAINSTSYSPAISSTANTRNVRLNNSEYGRPPIDINNSGEFYNYFTNGGFEHWFGGWDVISLDNQTFAQEADTVRSGQNALKIICDAVTDDAKMTFRFDDEQATVLQGKDLLIGAWVYFPDVTGQQGNSTRTVWPSILAKSYNGSFGTYEQLINPQYMPTNEWVFLSSRFTMQTDATRIYIYFYSNFDIGATVTTNNHVFIDDVILCGAEVPFSKIVNDTPTKDPNAMGWVDGGRLRRFDSAVPSDTDMYYNQGDIIYNNDPDTAEDIGWVCTVAGAGGTATWLPFGPID